MKKTCLILLTAILLIFSAFLTAATAETEENESLDEWTVMIYLCGSDLESKYGYATENLTEISRLSNPMLSYIRQEMPEQIKSTIRDPGKVNILVETGGSKEWHASETLNMPIDAGTLQRWAYRPETEYSGIMSSQQERKDSFEPLETLPLQSMASPDTLTDFIRWGVQQCPAKKYALVLWDHGNGAEGLFIDELYGNETMVLDELKKALEDAGTQLEAVVIDACMMANIETAWSLKNSARWMIASEEEVPGKGTAIRQWLQMLLAHPAMDGKWLGRCICDQTCVKYASGTDQMARSLMTWSVIDLSKVDRLVESFEKLFSAVNTSAGLLPELIQGYVRTICKLKTYGREKQSMRDIGNLLYNSELIDVIDSEIIEECMESLSDAVCYVVRGPGRASAMGLSFWYPTSFSGRNLDAYATVFPVPQYLAFLDALTTSWNAPEWVYDRTVRLAEIDTAEQFAFSIEKVIDRKGLPALYIPDEQNVDGIYYRLYQKDEDSGEIRLLGRTSCFFAFDDQERILYRANDPMHWPSIDGTPCCVQIIQDELFHRLYDIPVRINSKDSVLRCGREITYDDDGNELMSDYEVYGVWEGYDEDTSSMSRNAQPLAMLSGQEYCLLYPLDGQDRKGRTVYDTGKAMTVHRRLDVEKMTLPAGTYYLEYEVENIFREMLTLDRIEIHWDGENMSFPEGFTWSGEIDSRTI